MVRRAERVVRPLDRVGGEIEREALRSDVPPFAERDLGLGELVRRLSGKHLAGTCCRLEPRRRIHHGSGDEELTRRSQAGRGDAGFDAHAYLQRIPQSELRADTPETSADGQAGADRAERVVLVHGRQAEDRHHGVADELLRPAAERLQFLGGGVEELPEDLACALWVEALGETGGVDEVGEEDGDHLAFLGPERGGHHRPAVGAEARAGGERMTAHRTIHPRSIGGAPTPRRRSATDGPRSGRGLLVTALLRPRRRYRWRSNG